MEPFCAWRGGIDVSDFEYSRAHCEILWMLAATDVHFDEAEDIAQDTFLSEFECARQGLVIRSPRAWRRSVAGFKRAKLKRDKARRTELLRQFFRSRSGVKTNDVGSDADLNELGAALRTAIAELPLERKQVLHGYLEDYSFAEIAEQLGVPPATVSYRFWKALVALRRKLRRFGRKGDK
jgi:RNA polymerase sigma factor (sigma-70 family)